MRIFSRTSLATGTALALALGAPTAAYAQATYSFNLPAQDLGTSLRAVARRTGENIVFDPASVRGRRAAALNGSYSAAQAVERLLVGTGLEARRTSGGSWVVSGSGEAEARSAGADSESADAGATPEILVVGQRSLNTDIRRTEDDIQPYVVVGREEIETSNARSMDQLLRERITSLGNTSMSSQFNGGENTSSFNLRGLGSQQTLVLVDGRRLPPRSQAGVTGQPDLNGIPLAAVERIEVLPTTASGIYGGSATGGVINVVLRRDYSGIEAALTYEDSFRGGGGKRRFDLAAGFNLEDGRTNVLIAGTISDNDELLIRDRDFLVRGRELLVQNLPSFLTTPPLGATTNIRSSNGSILTLIPSLGGGSVGSAFTHIPMGYTGAGSDNGAALIANGGRYNLAPANTSQRNGGLAGLLNGSTVGSINVTVRRDFTPWLNIFSDVSYSQNVGSSAISSVSSTFTIPAGAPANPFNQAIRVTTPAFGAGFRAYSPYHSLRLTTGAIIRLGGGWSAEADFSWGRTGFNVRNGNGATLTAAAGAAVANGRTVNGETFNVFRDTNIFPISFSQFLTAPNVVEPNRSTARNLVARIGGPLNWLPLPGGAPTITALVEDRHEELGDYVIRSLSFPSITYGRSQHIRSGYVEANIPIVAPDNHVPIIHSLDVQIAVRHDRYSLNSSNQATFIPGVTLPADRLSFHNEFSATTPTVGVRWRPLPDISVRASFATGFLPPDLFQITPGETFPEDGSNFPGVVDPRRGNEALGSFDYLTGGGSYLRPERSRSWSVGAILTPRFLPGFRASADWIRIEKRDNVTLLSLSQSTLNDEALIPGVIIRGPASGGFPVGPIVAFNGGFINVARQTVEALDLALSYQVPTDIGMFRFDGHATHNIHNITQVLPTLPAIERAGLAANPPWRAVASITWDQGPWSAGWTSRYVSSTFILTSHAVFQSAGAAKIPDQMYHDVFVRYRFPEASEHGGNRALSGLEVLAGITNVFDTRPPIDAGNSQFYSGYGDPRLRSYYITLRKAFGGR